MNALNSNHLKVTVPVWTKHQVLVDGDSALEYNTIHNNSRYSLDIEL